MRVFKSRHIVFLFAFLWLSLTDGRVRAQQPDNSIDTSFFMMIDAANFDSLLNNFYMQQYVKSANRHQNRRATQLYSEFDNIPDSVFVKRLQDLHMVVPMTYNSDVRAYIKVYIRIMSRRLGAMLSLSEYYFPLFEETLDRYKVPEELKYLTIVESALNPQATSRAGAAGLWQFMYATGKNYDLEVNSLVDERRDPYKSTVAAARYLRALYDMYKDWTLAMAAYNCGPGNVNKAIARSGGKSNFWHIYPYLPRETRNYVPAFIGATYALNYYHEHGLTAGRYELPIRTDTIHLHGDIHFSIVERFTNIPVEQLRQLNPQFRTDVVPASSKVYALCLPSDKTSRFLQFEDTIYKLSKDTISRFSVIPVNSGTIVYHKLRKGETYSSIAKKYGVSVSNLRRWNGKSKNSALKVGSRLKIHLPASSAASQQSSAKDEVADTLAAADSTLVSPDSVTVNKTTRENRVDGQKNAKAQKSQSDNAAYYTVKRGDNLSSIASRNQTTVAKIKSLNNLKSDRIQVGQRLRVK